eukprot:5811958-Karenia_brevis.AAC.1
MRQEGSRRQRESAPSGNPSSRKSKILVPPAVDLDDAAEKETKAEGEGEVLMRRGVSVWLDELVGKEGEEAAKHKVAQAVAEELVERAKRLS